LEEQNAGLFTLTGGQELRELGQKLKHFTGIKNVPLPLNFQAELRNYQQHGLNWLQFLREYKFSGILADDMGLGKTIQTLVHLLLEKQQGRMTSPCLIIAPTSLMSNWRRETERFTPDLRVLTLQGTERKHLFDKIKEYDLILTTYPLLPRDEETLLEHEYHYLILDEAQTIKNPLSKAAQLVRHIKSTHRLCLTGTPMENHLGELWAQFDFLMPGFLGDSTTFKRLYRTPIEIHGNNEQRSRLSRRVAPFMLRRTKEEVARELPLKTEIIRSVPLYEQQAALYESIRLSMEKKVREAIAQKGLARSHITILDALLKLRQTCCDPRTLSLKEAQKLQESAKLDLLMELLPEQLEEGRRILVFSQFTRMIALIEKELNTRQISYSKLTGQTRNRDEAIEQFKSGEVNVFLISLKAGGVGLNLTEADTVIIYDPWWNPAVETQAADRAHRIGQDKPVFVYKLITENTVEEKILAMQERKRMLAESIYRNGAKEESSKLTAEDLTALFEPL
ncbi:MAG: DEAD/DEAH box helicase, partial [Methylobacter sp.]